MHSRRFWFNTIVVSVTVAVVFAIVLALLTATAVLAFGQKDAGSSDTDKTQTLTGVLTDTRCAARHPSNPRLNASECARLCIKQGASWALADGDVLYILKGDSPYFDRMAGQRVKVTGLLEGNSMQVQSMQPAVP